MLNVIRTGAAALILLRTIPTAANANDLPGWQAFARTVDRINDYTMHVTTHEVQGTSVEDRVYACSYAKPGFARSEIASGPGRGSAAVWHGGDTVRGHAGGFLRGIKIDVPEHDRRATDLRGNTIEMGYFPTIVKTFESIGKLSESPGPIVAGEETVAVTLVPAEPARERDLTREVLVISEQSHLPLEHLGYQGDTLVERESFTDYVIDPALPPSTFEL